MYEANISRALMRKGIKRSQFKDALSTQYGLSISDAMVDRFCIAAGKGTRGSCPIIEKCLDEQFGIVFDRGNWISKEGDYNEKG